MKYYDKLIFELSKEGRKGYTLPENRMKEYALTALTDGLKRADVPELPEVSEFDVVRHYTNISNKNFGVDTGFYPLGSCTMKYNPKINEEICSLPAFTGLHPLQPAATAQGALEVYYNLSCALAEIAGLAEFTLNPFAGAHGELTGPVSHQTWRFETYQGHCARQCAWHQSRQCGGVRPDGGRSEIEAGRTD